jgi:metal-responsive CopG/Arc/MetJ family transcriptional regulator
MGMKTAISLPDALYADVEQTAREMGIPRSQLFARAVSEFIKRYKRDEITQRLNEVYERTENQRAPELPTEPSVEAMRELTRYDTW